MSTGLVSWSTQELTAQRNRLCGHYLMLKATYAREPNPGAARDLIETRKVLQKILPAGYTHRWGQRDFFVDRGGALHIVPVK